jgi:hypothetical protein
MPHAMSKLEWIKTDISRPDPIYPVHLKRK